MNIPANLIDDRYGNVAAAIRQILTSEGYKLTIPLYHTNRPSFDHLWARGYADRHSNGEVGAAEAFTYVGTEKLLLWHYDQMRRRVSFDEALAKIDVPKRRAKYFRDRRKEREHKRSIPAPKALQHQLLVEAQGPGLTVNEDGEFSSRGLTDWYVRQFCQANDLKGG